jgi:hypothetical protein
MIRCDARPASRRGVFASNDDGRWLPCSTPWACARRARTIDSAAPFCARTRTWIGSASTAHFCSSPKLLLDAGPGGAAHPIVAMA